MTEGNTQLSHVESRRTVVEKLQYAAAEMYNSNAGEKKILIKGRTVRIKQYIMTFLFRPFS